MDEFHSNYNAHSKTTQCTSVNCIFTLSDDEVNTLLAFILTSFKTQQPSKLKKKKLDQTVKHTGI